MAKDSWFKAYTSILLSEKYVTLPDNDHRLVFWHFLAFQRKGIHRQPDYFLAPLCHCDIPKFSTIRATLINHNLLNNEGGVVGFDDMQVNKEAIRKRRQRDGTRHGTSHGTSHGTVPGDAEADAEAKSEAEKEPPLTPPAGGGASAGKTKPNGKFSQKHLDVAQQLTDLWNDHFGRNLSITDSLTSAVRAAWRKMPAATASDFKAVFSDRLKGQWVDPAEHVPASLIRAKDFEAHVARIKSAESFRVPNAEALEDQIHREFGWDDES